MLKDDLPALYGDILPLSFLQLDPEEKLATCGSCYKTKKESPRPHFDPQLKCCTYYPYLPNYLVGGILSDPQLQEGASRVRALIRDRRYALPIGVCPPAGYQVQFNNRQPGDYGHRYDLLCPYYVSKTGGCSVWAYRGHECATYFCHSSYADNGEKFWQEVRTSLFEFEMYLSQLAMLEFGFDDKEIDMNLTYLKNERHAEGSGWSLTAPEWSTLWAHQMESIEEYYIKTFQFVKVKASELKVGWNENRYNTSAAHTRFLESLLMGRPLPENHSPR